MGRSVRQNSENMESVRTTLGVRLRTLSQHYWSTIHNHLESWDLTREFSNCSEEHFVTLMQYCAPFRYALFIKFITDKLMVAQREDLLLVLIKMFPSIFDPISFTLYYDLLNYALKRNAIKLYSFLLTTEQAKCINVALHLKVVFGTKNPEFINLFLASLTREHVGFHIGLQNENFRSRILELLAKILLWASVNQHDQIQINMSEKFPECMEVVTKTAKSYLPGFSKSRPKRNAPPTEEGPSAKRCSRLEKPGAD